MFVSLAITELLEFNLQIFMESRDPDHAPFYPLTAFRKDVVFTMNRYNRATVNVREVFQSSIENALCRCQFGVKWG